MPTTDDYVSRVDWRGGASYDALRHTATIEEHRHIELRKSGSTGRWELISKATLRRLPLSDALDAMDAKRRADNTIKNMAYALRSYAEYVSRRGCDPMRPSREIWAMYAAALAAHLSPASYVVECSRLHENFFLWGVEHGYGEEIPYPTRAQIRTPHGFRQQRIVPDLPRQRPQKSYIVLDSQATHDRFLGALDRAALWPVKTMLASGARITEALEEVPKHWRDRRKGPDGVVILPATVKGGRRGALHFAPVAAAELEAYFKDHQQFLRADGSPWTRYTLAAEIKRASDAVGAHITAHSLRHAFASAFLMLLRQDSRRPLIEAVYALQYLLNHASPLTTINIYLHNFGFGSGRSPDGTRAGGHDGSHPRHTDGRAAPGRADMRERRRKLGLPPAASAWDCHRPEISPCETRLPGERRGFDRMLERGALGRAFIRASRLRAGSWKSRQKDNFLLTAIDRCLCGLEADGADRFVRMDQITPDVIAKLFAVIARADLRPGTRWDYSVCLRRLTSLALPEGTKFPRPPPPPDPSEPAVFEQYDIDQLLAKTSAAFEAFAARLSWVTGEESPPDGTGRCGPEATKELMSQWLREVGGVPLRRGALLAAGHSDFVSQLDSAGMRPFDLYALRYPTTMDVVTCKLLFCFDEGLGNQSLSDLDVGCRVRDSDGNIVFAYEKWRGRGPALTHPNRPDLARDAATIVRTYRVPRQGLERLVAPELQNRLWIAIHEWSPRENNVVVRDYEHGERFWYSDLEQWTRRNGLPTHSKFLQRLRKWAGRRDFLELGHDLEALRRRLGHGREIPLTYALAAFSRADRAQVIAQYHRDLHRAAMEQRSDPYAC